MNYDLALELKEAGFPQEVANRIHYRQSCEECMSGNFEKAMGKDMLDEFDIAIPTLSELITECGDEFYTLERQEKNLWVAHGPGFVVHFSGETPEIAVAKLYIALNKK